MQNKQEAPPSREGEVFNKGTPHKIRALLHPREALLEDCFAVMHVQEFMDIAFKGEQLATLLMHGHARLRNPHDPPPSESEYYSWFASLRALARIMKTAKFKDQMIVLEYCFPPADNYGLRMRADAIILGHDPHGFPSASIIELKQWDANIIGESQRQGMMWIKRDHMIREVPHPCRQPLEYDCMLQQMFIDQGLGDDYLRTYPYVFFHNIRKKMSREKNRALFGLQSRELRDLVEVCTGENAQFFADSLYMDVGGGGGEEVLKRLATVSMLKRLFSTYQN